MRHTKLTQARLQRRPPKLFLVTDDEVVARSDFIERAETVLAEAGGACALQLRARQLGALRFLELADRLGAAARAGGSGFWVNDRVDVALAVRSDGVQLGRASMSTEAARRMLGRAVWIGRSIHDPVEARRAVADGADLLVLGSIYATQSHPGAEPLGLAALRQAAAAGRPIVAIGGITRERVREIISAGAWGVAVRGGVWDAADPASAVGSYLAALFDES